jgi:hypothetical protein
MRRQGDVFLFTSSTPTTTLFSNHVDLNRRPATLLASAVLHALLGGIVAYGIVTAPNVVRVATERVSVRRLDLRTPEQQSASRSKPKAAHEVAKSLPAAIGHTPAALQQAIHAQAGPQTLLQPDLTAQTTPAPEIPVPRVMIWTPRKTEVKTIVPPEPAPATTAETKPSVDAPNPEVNLADLDIATSNNPTPKLPVLSGSTTPVVTQTQNSVQLPPSTTSQQAAEPTPTAVLSLSDLRMNDGSVTLPPINETQRQSAPGILFGSPDQSLNGEGSTNAPGSGNGNAVAGSGAAGTAGDQDGTTAGPTQGAATGTGASDQPTSTQITLPHDGVFGSVIVGQTVQDQYPEMTDVWSGRLAYTVYLHVGLSRSWILQYSLPRDDDAAAAGNATRLDAPWPYSIVRPNLGPGDVNADALMIHGYVDQSGHFEDLTMVFPQACPQAPFVLKSLEQWQFRPASQNGQVAKVEVLLIIPEELQ